MAWDDGSDDEEGSFIVAPRLSSVPFIKIYCFFDENDALDKVLRAQLVTDSEAQLIVESEEPLDPDPSCVQFVVEAVDEFGVWRALSSFQKLPSVSIQTVRLGLNSGWKRIQRRKAFRVKTDLEATISTMEIVRPTTYSGKIVDMSVAGAGVDVGRDSAHQLSGRYRLNFVLPSGSVSLVADVVSKRGNVVGFEFASVPLAQSKLLGTYVFEKQVARSNNDDDE